eukprot:CCRYP_005913-RB/>CCRYP_005913-RB protein AED:0.21 eAED:0.34 QI:527/0/0.66/1/0/0/3/251/151
MMNVNDALLVQHLLNAAVLVPSLGQHVLTEEHNPARVGNSIVNDSISAEPAEHTSTSIVQLQSAEYLREPGAHPLNALVVVNVPLLLQHPLMVAQSPDRSGDTQDSKELAVLHTSTSMSQLHVGSSFTDIIPGEAETSTHLATLQIWSLLL